MKSTNNDVPHYVIRFVLEQNSFELDCYTHHGSGGGGCAGLRSCVNVQIIALLRSVSLWHEMALTVSEHGCGPETV